MAFFDGLTATIYRYTPDGRRIYQNRRPTPEGYWRTYHVTDAVIDRFERRFRRTFAVTMVVIAFLPIINPGLFGTGNLLRAVMAGALVIIVLMEALMRLWVLRGIERVQVSPEELIPINRRERDIAHARATGMATLVAMLIGALLMALVAAMAIAESHTDRTGSVLGTVLFSLLAIAFGRQIYLLQRADKPHK